MFASVNVVMVTCLSGVISFHLAIVCGRLGNKVTDYLYKSLNGYIMDHKSERNDNCLMRITTSFNPS